jgi:hypothetical protein
VLPDVVCDFSGVRVEAVGPDRVRVTGARGAAPTGSYKVSATYADGYRASATMMVAGRDAAAKAQAVGEAILARAARMAGEAGFAPFEETLIEVLGADSVYGADSISHGAREVVLRLGVRHREKDAIAVFAREIYPAACSMAQGLTGFAGGRPAPQPVIRLFSCLVDKRAVTVEVDLAGRRRSVECPVGDDRPASEAASAAATPASAAEEATVETPLLALAHGRSGDKGALCNIGVLARRPEFVPALRQALTPEAVGAYFGHVAKGPVERYEWPGLNGFNFILHDSLRGGGVASLQNDPQGKSYAQALLDMRVRIPAALLDACPELAGGGAS